jgi:hypothetical protein
MPERIHKLTKELQAELDRAGALDPATRARLTELATEIDAAVDPEKDADFLPDALERVEQAAVSFEAEHPQVSGILRNIADTLTKLGI